MTQSPLQSSDPMPKPSGCGFITTVHRPRKPSTRPILHSAPSCLSPSAPSVPLRPWSPAQPPEEPVAAPPSIGWLPCDNGCQAPPHDEQHARG
ncbi:hypothetical protein PMIN04_004036 [Paraphaeosphaeria minitans]